MTNNIEGKNIIIPSKEAHYDVLARMLNFKNVAQQIMSAGDFKIEHITSAMQFDQWEETSLRHFGIFRNLQALYGYEFGPSSKIYVTDTNKKREGNDQNNRKYVSLVALNGELGGNNLGVLDEAISEKDLLSHCNFNKIFFVYDKVQHKLTSQELMWGTDGRLHIKVQDPRDKNNFFPGAPVTYPADAKALSSAAPIVFAPEEVLTAMAKYNEMLTREQAIKYAQEDPRRRRYPVDIIDTQPKEKTSNDESLEAISGLYDTAIANVLIDRNLKNKALSYVIEYIQNSRTKFYKLAVSGFSTMDPFLFSAFLDKLSYESLPKPINHDRFYAAIDKGLQGGERAELERLYRRLFLEKAGRLIEIVDNGSGSHILDQLRTDADKPVKFTYEALQAHLAKSVFTPQYVQFTLRMR